MTYRSCLITGASRGIGAQTARLLAQDGMSLIGLHYHSSREPVELLARELEDIGAEVFLLQADLAADPVQAAQVLGQRFLREVELRGGQRWVDLLVCNAGEASNEEIGHVTYDVFSRLVSINMATPLFLVQELLPHFRPGGRIITVSTALTRVAAPQQLVYTATKAALNSLTVSLAQALGDRDITVNAVTPGYIDTDRVRARLALSGEREALASLSALGRIGAPDDVAQIIRFLASDASRWITGQIIDASGGSGITGGLHRKKTAAV